MKDVFLKLIGNTTFLTVRSRVLVYVLSQLYMEKIINPRKEFRAIRQKIIYSISMYSQYYHNPYNLLNEKSNIRDKSEYENASIEMRKVGCELAGYIGTIPKIRFNKIKKLNVVLDSLIGISNGFYIVSKNYNVIKDNKEDEEVIKKILDFK